MWASNQHVEETKYQNVESYIIGEDDTLPGLNRMQYFIKAQGFTVDEYDMYHEKLGVIILEKIECKIEPQLKKNSGALFFDQGSYCGWR